VGRFAVPQRVHSHAASQWMVRDFLLGECCDPPRGTGGRRANRTAAARAKAKVLRRSRDRGKPRSLSMGPLGSCVIARPADGSMREGFLQGRGGTAAVLGNSASRETTATEAETVDSRELRAQASDPRGSAPLGTPEHEVDHAAVAPSWFFGGSSLTGSVPLLRRESLPGFSFTSRHPILCRE
jgi:hypothetical protein